jgi:short-subunit dehydrogenase
MRPLDNQFAVVTGASSGIGKAIALALAAKGATTCLLGRNVKALEQVAAIAQRTAPRSRFFNVDLSIDQEIRVFAESLHTDDECVDILVHSAGIISLGPIASASVDDFDRQYRVNVRAPYVLTQYLLPLVISSHGQIVFINSSAGLNAGVKTGQYAATKFALKAIADSLREEINADGVRVLSVFPGRTASPMQASVFKMEGREYRPDLLMQPENVADIVVNALTLPRSAEVTEISVRPFNKSY